MRRSIQTDATEAQALAEETLLVPEHHIYQLRAKVKYNVDSQQLNAAYQALTDAHRDLQDFLITQKKDLMILFLKPLFYAISSKSSRRPIG